MLETTACGEMKITTATLITIVSHIGDYKEIYFPNKAELEITVSLKYPKFASTIQQTQESYAMKNDFYYFQETHNTSW